MSEKTTLLQICPAKNLHTFISVPHVIYQEDHCWPGQDDEKEEQFFDVRYNLSLRYHEWQLFYACEDEKVVGRICVSIWKAFNDRWKKSVAFFGFFECINDQMVADQLFLMAKKWARERDMQELWGPIAFNLEGPMGLLVNGADRIPTYGLPYNPPYYENLCEKHGFRKAKDFVELTYPVQVFCNNAENLVSRVDHLMNDSSFQIRSVSPASFEEDIMGIIYVQNQSIANHWGSGEMQLAEMTQKYEDLYYNIGPQELLLVVERNAQIIGFIFFHQDQNQLLHAGRFNYPGRVTRVRGNTVGLLPEYQQLKIGTWLTIEIAKRLPKYGFEEVQIGWIIEDNAPSLRKCANFGAKIDKVFRVYSIGL